MMSFAQDLVILLFEQGFNRIFRKTLTQSTISLARTMQIQILAFLFIANT